jgi:hypothetical protein
VKVSLHTRKEKGKEKEKDSDVPAQINQEYEPLKRARAEFAEDDPRHPDHPKFSGKRPKIAVPGKLFAWLSVLLILFSQ